MIKKEGVFKKLISDDDFEKIKTNCKEDKLENPIIELLKDESEITDSTNYIRYTRENVKHSISLLYENHYVWLEKEKVKFLEKNRANVSAALGEIRCFGYLAEVFGTEKVNEIFEDDHPTPDFCVDINGTKVCVETNTVQINESQGDSLREFESCRQQQFKNKEKISIMEHSTRPFGDRDEATIVQSTILKLIGIKEQNHQLLKETPTVLWVDLQDFYMNVIANRIGKSGPLYSGISPGSSFEGIWSNELWYSVYSEKNDPVFEGQTLNCDEGNKCKLRKNIHYGKFFDEERNNYENVSAIIYYGPSALVLYENPNAINKLPNEFIEKISSGRWFKIESSRINYPNNQLSNKLNQDKQQLKALGSKTFYSW